MLKPVHAREIAVRIARRLLEAGHTAYFAGGCVRDRLLGRDPKDYDIATSATPDEVLRLFPRGKQVGAHFGVILVRDEGHVTEIATFRTDGSYSDGRHPDSVEFSTPEEDVRRRDFTINALFEHPLSGEIIDHVGGQRDLEQKVLRTVGEPRARFGEDALRLLRAVRFAVRFEFEIEPDTWRAICDLGASLRRISTERVRDEFSAILVDPRRARGFELLTESGLMDHIIPEARALIGCDQPPQWHPEGDVHTHTRLMLGMLQPDAPLVLCLAVLLHDIGKPPTRTVDASGRIRFNSHDAVGARMAEEILRRLKYPNHVIETVSFMVRRHMRFSNVQDMRVAKLKRFMSAPSFPLEMELHRVDCASSNGLTDNWEFLKARREEFASAPIIPKPLVTGHDLIRLGLRPGPEFREILMAAQTEQLEGRLKTAQEAQEWLARVAAEY